VSYVALAEHYRLLSQLRHVEAITSWDESTMMPTGGGPARAEALSVLRGLIHQHATCEGLADLFAAAAAEEANLPPWQQANLREMTREWVRAGALPLKLVEAMSQAESQSEQAWRKLRPDNDFAGFLPFFREVVQLKREAAQAWAEQLSLSPYDALMDGFEPGARTKEIAPLFARLRAFLPGFIAKALERQRASPPQPAKVRFPSRASAAGTGTHAPPGLRLQPWALGHQHHPFCGGVPTDVRITTRYSTDDYSKSMMSVLHESGHAKYEQNLPRTWLGQPVGLARGMSIHESQSLLTEMQVCRGRAFLEFAAPFIAQAFPDAATRAPEAFTPETLFRRLARVKPGLIRVDADEATYPCHIVLRFELEQRLIDGSLRPEDVPEAWDTGMREVSACRPAETIATAACRTFIGRPA
jgi:carboxypeptidase Taq